MLSGLAHAMGRAGRTDLPRDVRDRAEHPLTARQAAAWWLNLSIGCRLRVGNAGGGGCVERGVGVKGTVSPGLIYCLRGRSSG
ncbi:hypothetical protein QF037_009056 [Streptomyces canus]|nr:hypothetical protein [Streptomyces canus]